MLEEEIIGIGKTVKKYKFIWSQLPSLLRK